MSKKKRSVSPDRTRASGAVPSKSSDAARSGERKVPSARGRSKTPWILGAVGLVIAVLAFGGPGDKEGSRTAGLGAGVAPPEEAKYIGRFLPAGYEEPNVGGGLFTGAKQMAPVSATMTDEGVEVAVADVKEGRIVSFEYAKTDSETILMVAYVKLSGKLFVGVSYCVPCKGTGQDIASDGTLTCQSCGTKRDLESGVGVSGSCKLYPLDELPVRIVGDKIVIEKSVLDAWTVQPLDRKVG